MRTSGPSAGGGRCAKSGSTRCATSGSGQHRCRSSPARLTRRSVTTAARTAGRCRVTTAACAAWTELSTGFAVHDAAAAIEQAAFAPMLNRVLDQRPAGHDFERGRLGKPVRCSVNAQAIFEAAPDKGRGRSSAYSFWRRSSNSNGSPSRKCSREAESGCPAWCAVEGFLGSAGATAESAMAILSTTVARKSWADRVSPFAVQQLHEYLLGHSGVAPVAWITFVHFSIGAQELAELVGRVADRLGILGRKALAELRPVSSRRSPR